MLTEETSGWRWAFRESLSLKPSVAPESLFVYVFDLGYLAERKQVDGGVFVPEVKLGRFAPPQRVLVVQVNGRPRMTGAKSGTKGADQQGHGIATR